MSFVWKTPDSEFLTLWFPLNLFQCLTRKKYLSPDDWFSFPSRRKQWLPLKYLAFAKFVLFDFTDYTENSNYRVIRIFIPFVRFVHLQYLIGKLNSEFRWLFTLSTDIRQLNDLTPINTCGFWGIFTLLIFINVF